ncbi:hypothetical protein BDK51DRAFT_50116 [Blyttiomyces helicus]|uniref:Uncharacterized protein n=1 Tax=Blyttiomyces helicus TaxID=388810 RepID=A0A4P9W4S3_9FUNG|nr:hypothetical protein BDK51DRAFT_50116 [Blyttiomyces helicus]|eukprot:RKO85176.1 hypothetical protein BDK51DRAFT_50116 [Blyttiomyces helicus]
MEAPGGIACKVSGMWPVDSLSDPLVSPLPPDAPSRSYGYDYGHPEYESYGQKGYGGYGCVLVASFGDQDCSTRGNMEGGCGYGGRHRVNDKRARDTNRRKPSVTIPESHRECPSCPQPSPSIPSPRIRSRFAALAVAVALAVGIVAVALTVGIVSVAFAERVVTLTVRVVVLAVRVVTLAVRVVALAIRVAALTVRFVALSVRVVAGSWLFGV